MDEYVGLDKDAPQGFGNFLKERLFKAVSCRQVHYLNGNAADPGQECKRYTDLLNQYPADIVCLGIGENTHLAFNDPHVADFNDPEIVKVVDLDEQCRLQQVNDGCFRSLDEVPTLALTITIPALFKAHYASAVVPGELKASAIYHTLNSEMTEKYPSTILRRHKNAVLYIDEKSAQKL
jgi:glucosamine-6-phosphate deaminase